MKGTVYIVYNDVEVGGICQGTFYMNNNLQYFQAEHCPSCFLYYLVVFHLACHHWFKIITTHFRNALTFSSGHDSLVFIKVFQICLFAYNCNLPCIKSNWDCFTCLCPFWLRCTIVTTTVALILATCHCFGSSLQIFVVQNDFSPSLNCLVCVDRN